MQIQIGAGTYTDSGAEFRTSYPRNLVPVIKDTGISKLFLRTAEGLTRFDSGAPTIAGFDRGGINWQGICYRVIGSSFVSISAAGVVTVLGTLMNDGLPVAMAYGYSNQGIGIVSGKSFYYYVGGSLQQVTDSNVGSPIDLLWMGGYFVLFDGTYSYVTDLDNQFNINSQKYGSDSNSPDALNGGLKFRNELYLCNRYTIAVMDNAGGTGYPFVENVGATIQKGVIGPQAKCITSQGFAFVGSAADEAPSVFLSVGLGIAQPIATREVQIVMGQYTEEQLYGVTLEYCADKDRQLVYMHLPNETFVYDVKGSQGAGEPLWYMLDSSVDGSGAWRAWHPVYCYGKFIFGDKIDQRVGFSDPTTAQQYDVDARWQFDTIFAYNSAHGITVYALELIGMYGRAALGENDTMSMQYTDDGLSYSLPRYKRMGTQGQTKKRPQWRPKHFFRNFRGYRFAGYNAAPVSFAALEATIEPLAA